MGIGVVATTMNVRTWLVASVNVTTLRLTASRLNPGHSPEEAEHVVRPAKLVGSGFGLKPLSAT